MLVSRTIALDLEDMTKIQEKIENGDFKNVSEFVQQAVKNELKRGQNCQKSLKLF